MWRFLRLRAHQVATRFLPLLFAGFTVFAATSTAHAADTLLTFMKTEDNATIGQMTLQSTTIHDYRLNLFDNGTNPFNYVSVELNITQGGKYFFGQTQGGMDTVMLLYKGSFNPNSVRTNLLAANDDWYRFDNNKMGTQYDTKTPADKCAGEYSCIKLDDTTTLNLNKCGPYTRFCPGMYANLESNTKYYMIVSHFNSSERAQFTLPQTFWCYGASCEMRQAQIDPAPAPQPDPAPAPTPPAPTTPPQPVYKGGADSVTTFLSLITQEQGLAQVMSREASRLVGAVENDCAAFDMQGYCTSFRMRAMVGTSVYEGAGVFILSKRVSDSVHVGAFIDYVVTSQDPTGFRLKDERPTFGGFVGYTQNSDRSGYQAKLSVAYGSGTLISTREVVLYSEAGNGSAGLHTYALRGEAGYGITYGTLLVTPFVAARHLQVIRGRYTENLELGSVEAPLSFGESRLNLTTAIVGLRIEGRFTEQLGYQASLAGEYDVLRRISAMRGTSQIDKLEFFGIERSFNKDPLRLYAMTGVFWEFAKNNRVFAQAALRGNPHSVGSMTTLLGYQVSF